MNAAIGYLSGTGLVPERRQLARVAAGVAISLALHALLLSAYRRPQPAPVPAPVPAQAPLTLRLRPAELATPPATPPAPAKAATEAPSAPRSKAAPARRTRPSRPARAVIAVPPDTRQSQEDTFSVEPAPAPAPAPAPKFDLDAARSMARKLANDPDPSKAGTALERLPPKPLETESRLARGIRAAKRANCKDGIPGGLLAPLFLLMDKKDSGCKW
jgi:hypothetical protein